MADTAAMTELEELKELMQIKALYGWDDEDPTFLAKRNIIKKKYLSQAKSDLKKLTVGDKGGPSVKNEGPKFSEWEHVVTFKAKSFDSAYGKLEEVAAGTWKADKWSRGGVVTYDSQKNCNWKRRMTTDGKHFARIIEVNDKYVIQRGILASGVAENDAEAETTTDGPVEGQGADDVEASEDERPSKKKKKDKVVDNPVKKEKQAEEPPPAKRPRTQRKRE